MKLTVKQVANSVLIVFVFFVNSCNYSKKETENSINRVKNNITIYDFQIWLSNLDKVELRDSVKASIYTLVYNSQKDYFYSNSFEQDSNYFYKYSIRQDSFFYSDEYCKIIDTLSLNFQNKNIDIKVSYFDKVNLVDEESQIYWSKDYGLISVYNHPQGALILFDNDRIHGFAKNEFYNYIINQEKEMKNKRIQELNKN